MRRLLPAVLLPLLLALPGPAHAQAPRTTLRLPSGWPQAMAIPRIGVRAPVQPDPLTHLLPIQDQPKWGNALWWNHGAKPGQRGHALFYGHLDSFTGPALFWNLHELKPGDLVRVGYHTGVLTFRVMWLHDYPDAAVPYHWIYGRDNQRGMILVTCSGAFHGLTHGGYDHRLLVYTRMVDPQGKLL